MFLESNLEKFLTKRVIVFTVILSAADVIFINDKWFALCGLIIGATVSVMKFASYSMVFTRIMSPQMLDSQANSGVAKTVISFIFNQLVVVIVLFVAIIISLWLFIGVAVGILLVPMVIMVNIFTEALGITHNDYR